MGDRDEFRGNYFGGNTICFFFVASKIEMVTFVVKGVVYYAKRNQAHVFKI